MGGLLMPGKHNAGGCKCCGDACWGCATPLGISVSILSNALACLNCNSGTGTYLATAANFNTLGVASGFGQFFVPCRANWNTQADCCNVVTGRVYRWQRGVWSFELTHGIASGNPYAQVFARYDFTEWAIQDASPGSGVGDPCTKAWNFLQNTQTIDGWTRTLTQQQIASQAFYYKEFTEGCPTTDQVIPFEPAFPNSTVAPCDARVLTVTVLMT